MFGDGSTGTKNQIFMRHDLMVELGRLEMAMEEAGSTDTDNVLESLQAKRDRIAAALSKLTQQG
ncbi:MAG: hypothetical protein ACREPT_00075 [Rudaea sp.]